MVCLYVGLIRRGVVYKSGHGQGEQNGPGLVYTDERPWCREASFARRLKSSHGSTAMRDPIEAANLLLHNREEIDACCSECENYGAHQILNLSTTKAMKMYLRDQRGAPGEATQAQTKPATFTEWMLNGISSGYLDDRIAVAFARHEVTDRPIVVYAKDIKDALAAIDAKAKVASPVISTGPVGQIRSKAAESVAVVEVPKVTQEPAPIEDEVLESEPTLTTEPANPIVHTTVEVQIVPRAKWDTMSRGQRNAIRRKQPFDSFAMAGPVLLTSKLSTAHLPHANEVHRAAMRTFELVSPLSCSAGYPYDLYSTTKKGDTNYDSIGNCLMVNYGAYNADGLFDSAFDGSKTTQRKADVALGLLIAGISEDVKLSEVEPLRHLFQGTGWIANDSHEFAYVNTLTATAFYVELTPSGKQEPVWDYICPNQKIGRPKAQSDLFFIPEIGATEIAILLEREYDSGVVDAVAHYSEKAWNFLCEVADLYINDTDTSLFKSKRHYNDVLFAYLCIYIYGGVNDAGDVREYMKELKHTLCQLTVKYIKQLPNNMKKVPFSKFYGAPINRYFDKDQTKPLQLVPIYSTAIFSVFASVILPAMIVSAEEGLSSDIKTMASDIKDLGNVLLNNLSRFFRLDNRSEFDLNDQLATDAVKNIYNQIGAMERQRSVRIKATMDFVQVDMEKDDTETRKCVCSAQNHILSKTPLFTDTDVLITSSGSDNTNVTGTYTQRRNKTTRLVHDYIQMYKTLQTEQHYEFDTYEFAHPEVVKDELAKFDNLESIPDKVDVSSYKTIKTNPAEKEGCISVKDTIQNGVDIFVAIESYIEDVERVKKHLIEKNQQEAADAKGGNDSEKLDPDKVASLRAAFDALDVPDSEEKLDPDKVASLRAAFDALDVPDSEEKLDPDKVAADQTLDDLIVDAISKREEFDEAFLLLKKNTIEGTLTQSEFDQLVAADARLKEMKEDSDMAEARVRSLLKDDSAKLQTVNMMFENDREHLLKKGSIDAKLRATSIAEDAVPGDGNCQFHALAKMLERVSHKASLRS